jgi:hypothetical protein
MATPETSRPHRGDRARESADGDALAVEAANGATGLLVVDMISCWDFPDADKLLPVAAQVAPRIAALKRRCGQRGVPVIYANDNRGRWRSDFGALVELSVSCGGTGAAITSALMPRDCTGTQTARRHAMLMEQCGVVFGIATTPGSHIRLPAPTGAARHD